MEPNTNKGLSGSALKIFAILAMTIDHTGIMLGRIHPCMTDPFIVLAGQEIHPYGIMRLIGRLAFPLFGFLVAEGITHTRNSVRYGASLLIAAILSEPFYDAFFFSNALDFTRQNVLFTLFLGFAAISLAEKLKERPWAAMASVASVILSAELLKVDYGAAGVACILLLHLLKDNLSPYRYLALLLLPWPMAAATSAIPLMLYNGQRGFILAKWMKYAFYVYYPLHLFILTVLSATL